MTKRILIADDSDTVRRVICTFLTEQNFQVCGDAVDGEDAIEKAWKLKPDLVLLDIAMPRTNGIVAASVLKDMLPNVRIVLFTAVDAVISKADGLGGLAECIQNLLPS
jgi:DNA-binding NarL/FixJ family response regulator